MKAGFALVLMRFTFLALDVARADIPPPPPPPPPSPAVPLVHTAVPEVWQVVAAGLALSLALAGSGLWLARKRENPHGRGRGLSPCRWPLALSSPPSPRGGARGSKPSMPIAGSLRRPSTASG
jgi:hypothetical protein